MKKVAIFVLAIIALLLFSNLTNIKILAYPTADTQTLMTSLSPPNATIGTTVSWLIWTDPNLSGHSVDLEITDMTNSTTIYSSSETLGTQNQCGSLTKNVSTVEYSQHDYRFSATLTVGNMRIESSKYLDLTTISTAFNIAAYTDPSTAIPGDTVNLTIFETVYPYVDATANFTVYNASNPSLYSMTGMQIPATNGSVNVGFPTTGLVSGFYQINITAASAQGTSKYSTYMQLTDVIVTIENYFVYIGQQANVTVRTYPSATETGIQISRFIFPPEIVIDEIVPLTNGRANRLYDTTMWAPALYLAVANATVGPNTFMGTSSFTLASFEVNVDVPKFEFTIGEQIPINVSTTPAQPNAAFNLTISNSTMDVVWTYGPSTLDTNGRAVVTFNSTGFLAGTYDIDAVVNTTQYTKTGSASFDLVPLAFDIYADIEPYSNTEYAMPILNVTVNPPQTNANLTFEVEQPNVYNFTKSGFDISTWMYPIPAMALKNGSYYVIVTVTSSIGTNSTDALFHYSNGYDTDGDGLSDTNEASRATSSTNPDTDADGFFDGMEVYHGTNPLDPTSFIPEQFIMLSIAALSTISIIFASAKLRKRKSL
jgi:hypothetical protein